jgi:hypothetical protein
MEIDSNKYNSLLSNLVVELIVRLQNYAEAFSLSFLSVFTDHTNKIDTLVSQCIYELGQSGIKFPPNFPVETIVKSGSRRAAWMYRECDFSSLGRRIRAREEEDRSLYELQKTYKVYKQIKDLE